MDVTKTGSRTLYQVLQQHYEGQQIGKVRARIPGYFHFTVVRNPYDRCVSLWWSTCMRSGDRYGYKVHGETVADLINWLIGGGTGNPVAKRLCVPQPKQITVLPDWVIKYENLERGFQKLPFYTGEPKEFPRLNQTITERKPWQEYMTPEAIRAINRWCASEFDLFNYEKLQP